MENKLEGRIPSELGDLAELEGLELGRNQLLTGAIPPELGRLSKLERLWIGGTGLTGAIPPELGKLSNLRELYLGSANLTGPIPPELGQLTRLGRLYPIGQPSDRRDSARTRKPFQPGGPAARAKPAHGCVAHVRAADHRS